MNPSSTDIFLSLNGKSVDLPASLDVENVNKQMHRLQSMYEKEQDMAQVGAAKKEALPPTKAAILDKEIYIPYQAAIDSVLDDTFETQPLMVQMLQGWMAEVFRRFAQKNKAYQDIVITCTAKIQLRQQGKPFGNVMPADQRPQANHVFLTLRKLKQLKKPMTRGDWDYYLVRDLPDNIKKGFVYIAIEDVIPGLLDYLKSNRIQLLLCNDFTFALPAALLANETYKGIFEAMPTEKGVDGATIYVSTQLHKFKFI